MYLSQDTKTATSVNDPGYHFDKHILTMYSERNLILITGFI